MLGLEALWLFAQPSGFLGLRGSSTGRGSAASKLITTTTAADKGPTLTSGKEPLALWPIFLLKMLSCAESQATLVDSAAATAADEDGVIAASDTTNSAAPASAMADAAGGLQLDPESDRAGLTAANIQDVLVMPAAPLLFGMLAEALQQLSDIWTSDPAAVKAALVKDTLSDSSLPEPAKQKKLKALLGNSKPSPADQVADNRWWQQQ